MEYLCGNFRKKKVKNFHLICIYEWNTTLIISYILSYIFTFIKFYCFVQSDFPKKKKIIEKVLKKRSAMFTTNYNKLLLVLI